MSAKKGKTGNPYFNTMFLLLSVVAVIV